MNLTIPRFFFNRTTRCGDPGSIAVNQVWFESLIVDTPDELRALAMFSTRDAAQAYAQQHNLGTEWLVTFFGYTELANLLRACLPFGVTCVVRDPQAAAPHVATIATLLPAIDGFRDTGDDVRAEFSRVATARPPVR